MKFVARTIHAADGVHYYDGEAPDDITSEIIGKELDVVQPYWDEQKRKEVESEPVKMFVHRVDIAGKKGETVSLVLAREPLDREKTVEDITDEPEGE